jgi:ABC-type branched-subunit amino acid transport system substrate-binding protein
MRWPLLLLIGAAAGCGPSEADKPIELGHIYPPAVEPGDEERALNLAVEELNQHPDRLPRGRQLKIRHAPGGPRPEDWGAQASRLIALNKVGGLIGGDRGAIAERVGAAVQGGNVVAISTAGWSGPTTAQNLFAVGLSPAERGRALAARAGQVNPKTILVVQDPGAGAARVAADRFAAELRASHASVSIRVVDVAEPKKPPADVVFFACPARTAVQQRDQFKDALVLFGDEDAELPALLAEGERAEGFVVATAVNPADKVERLAAFASRYQEQHKRPPSVAAVLAYDALSVWVEAARRADSLEAADIRSQLQKQDPPFEVLAGSITFAEDHTARRPAVVARVRGGALQPEGN